jgi:4-hydroxybenzoate polyprenyltransferase
LVTIISYPFVCLYPTLKRFTYMAQAGGAFIMAWIVVMSWMACAGTSYSTDLTIQGLHEVGQSAMKIVTGDWAYVALVFTAEFLFCFMSETVYACMVSGVYCNHLMADSYTYWKDIEDDIILGLYSAPILFDEKGVKRLVLTLAFIYPCLLAIARGAVPTSLLMIAPLSVSFVHAAQKLNTLDPASCGTYVKTVLRAKIMICVILWIDFIVRCFIVS